MTQTATLTRAEALRAATHDAHERLDRTIMAAKPFDSVENYGRFAAMQYSLHHHTAPLYARADLADHIADLPALSRFSAVTQDLADLGVALPHPGAPVGDLPLPEALGWLYVIEGSNLGAAFLLKAAQKLGLSEDHGARHLAGAPEGRAAHWRTFKAGLDAAPLAPEDEARVIAGAVAAFDHARGLAQRCFA
ncbi:biliverdin-producing heme oxygenase [Paenirhodobacter populi]|uniref:biliverdin-producing heme oxygenase n=1 Tax=Paenirhodobacter populi TaxID=2306993 RepID=UPI000FE3B2D0|nr:biliverdin-producing heme oxygenase [Sinirhodobacter populi]RWR06846.1 biliverdin-producing heme oxygenase [Sinirhodobacter populi]RWR07429.1 biliverdin-producing heme oxygenase [Sinirhodobacter populi]